MAEAETVAEAKTEAAAVAVAVTVAVACNAKVSSKFLTNFFFFFANLAESFLIAIRSRRQLINQA